MKQFSTILILTLLSSFSFGQYSTKGYGFQGYAVDQDGKALANQTVSVKFTISSATAGAPSFTETKSLQTDAFGVFSHEIGEGDGNFGKLNFNRFDYSLKVEIGTVIISDKILAAVPYARSAANGTPVGTILPFAGPESTVPEGWLVCDGRTLTNVGEYAQLYDVIQTTWGGTGATSFKIPDLRGVFLRGVNGMGTNGNRSDAYADDLVTRQLGTFQNDEVKKHNHTITDPGHNHAYIDRWAHERGPTTAPAGSGTMWRDPVLKGATPGVGGAGDSDNNQFLFLLDITDPTSIGVNDQNAAHGKKTTGITINNTATGEGRPKNAAVLYIIKY